MLPYFKKYPVYPMIDAHGCRAPGLYSLQLAYSGCTRCIEDTQYFWYRCVMFKRIYRRSVRERICDFVMCSMTVSQYVFCVSVCLSRCVCSFVSVHFLHFCESCEPCYVCQVIKAYNSVRKNPAQYAHCTDYGTGKTVTPTMFYILKRICKCSLMLK